MTTEHEQPSTGADEREAQRYADLLQRRADVYSPLRNSSPYYGDDDIDLLRSMIDAARLALAERDAEISALKVTINNMTAGLRQTRDEYEAEIAKLKADNHWPIAELPDCMMPDGAEPCDGFKSLQAELVETGRQLQQAEEELTRFKTPGSLSGKLNPFPERLPATQATEIAEKLIRAYLLDVGAGMDDFTQHEVEFSEKIAAAIGAAAHASSGASALEIAERFRLFFQRPYPTSEEGVERAVQALAQEIEAAIRHNEARPGTAALEATRDLFQSIEGWRPTDDWTGVPPRLKLMFDRTLHAIEGAEARGRAEAFLAGEECAVDNVLAILDEEGWLGQTKHRVHALVTKEPSA